MKSTLRILTLAAASGIPLLAQQAASSPDQSVALPQAIIPQTPPSAPGSTQAATASAVPVPSTANSPEVANNELRPVAGELVSKLDTKSAKTGDSVVIRTAEKATTSTGLEIPKGSRIVGHVTDVEAEGKSGDNSRLAIKFDHAQLKSGQSLPIKSVIQSISPAGGGTGGTEAFGGSPVVSAAEPGSGGAMAGSRGPATMGSPSAGGPQTAPSAGMSQPGAATTSVGGPPPVGTVVAKNGNVAIRTTAIPGVLLAGNINGQPFSNASGALLGARQNVHLDGGTMMVVAIATSPAGNAR